MVIHSLPKKLIHAVRKINKKKSPSYLEKLAVKLKNADHRSSAQISLNQPGGRIRELSVQRNYPGIKKVILKRAHGGIGGNVDAREIVRYLRKMVNTHNKVFGENDYYLEKPIAYPVGKQFVLMAKANKFSVDQLLAQNPAERFANYTPSSPNSPGKFLNEISIDSKKSVHKLKRELNHAIILLNRRTQLGIENFLVVGYKDGKFIFVPLIDLF